MTEASPLTLNRLSIYLRCLQDLSRRGVERISSTDMADLYQLSASQIRKDLAQFGEFGIRGVGYEVEPLAYQLRSILGLDQAYGMVIVGIGALGTALARYPGFRQGDFQVVGLVDRDPRKVGGRLGRLVIHPPEELPRLVRETGARIGVLTVPSSAAQGALDAVVAAGIRAVLNFAPAQVRASPGVRIKAVDPRIDLEELAYFLQR
ncbi:MAG TPA: redox-sensing transcriptional repressor Rex [Thermoanaerobaculia bacterium]|nr:redox-sensing transcriptional repressor Rex [Thermoanaerobaculia bacterium]